MTTKPDETPSSAPGRAARVGAAALCLLGLVALGFAAGGFLGGRVFGGGEVGWDALANALGGAMIGIAAAIVVFVVLVGRLTMRVMVWTGVGGLVVAIILLVVPRLLEP